jgi:hypothetical protein
MFLITIIDNKLKTYLLDDCKILTAGKPFVLAHFNDKTIHDTHLGTTKTDYLFQEDFNSKTIGMNITSAGKAELWNKIRDIMKKVSNIISQSQHRVKQYYNFKHSFQIMGIDMMILDNLQPILLECNTKPGFTPKAEKGQILQKKIFKLLDEKVFQIVFNSNKSNDSSKAKDPYLLYSD